MLNRRKAILALTATVAGFLLVEPSLVETNLIFVERIEVEEKRIPYSFNGYRVAQVTDTHLHEIGFREKRYMYSLHSMLTSLT